RNAQAYAARLEALHAAYQRGLAACERRVFIASHAAFGYLARDYGLRQITAAGLSPEQEPTPRELAALAEEARELGVQYVFSERLVSPRLAQTLASEIGAGVLVLDPLEGLTPEQVRAGEDYFTIMRQNLENLRTALACR
ncbi:MAG TPA: zinc ABC transporter substrate-binding protein, partial [Limnochordia bacterium]